MKSPSLLLDSPCSLSGKGEAQLRVCGGDGGTQRRNDCAAKSGSPFGLPPSAHAFDRTFTVEPVRESTLPQRERLLANHTPPSTPFCIRDKSRVRPHAFSQHTTHT